MDELKCFRTIRWCNTACVFWGTLCGMATVFAAGDQGVGRWANACVAAGSLAMLLLTSHQHDVAVKQGERLIQENPHGRATAPGNADQTGETAGP